MSHSPDIAPHHEHKKEETKQPIQVVKVVQSTEPRDASPTFKEQAEFVIQHAQKNDRTAQLIKDDHFKDQQPALLVNKNEGRTTTFQMPKDVRAQLMKQMAEESKQEEEVKQSQGLQGDQKSLKELRLAEI